MKYTLLLSLLTLICLLCFPVPLRAATNDSTASATPDSETTTQNLKDRIEKVVQERQEQIQGVVDDLAQKKRGFIGEVQRVSESSITVKNIHGTQIIAINDQVQLTKSNKDIEIDGIAVGDWALIMGYIKDDNFEPKKIQISTETLRPKNYTVYLGTVDTISKSQISLIPRSGGDSVIIDFDSKTDYQDLQGETIKMSEIQAESQVLIVAYEDKNEDQLATTVRSLGISSQNNE